MEYNWDKHEDIIKINKERLDKNNVSYNPLAGTVVHEYMPRNLLELPDAPITKMYIPDEMEDEPIVRALRLAGSLKRASLCLFKSTKMSGDEVRIWKRFIRIRQHYDFEYWCATKWTIVDKVTGLEVPFFLNRPQRTILLPELEHLRKTGQPINIDLLKARQWGGSTMIDAYQTWIQMEWKTNWNSVICADVDDQAKIVLGMMDRAVNNYDTTLTGEDQPQLKPYMHTDGTRILTPSNSTISIGSAKHPEKIRSQNLKMAHLTEIGVWASTKMRKPEDLIQAIFGSINPAPYTMKALESTAKGVGNYWHNHYMAAKAGRNGFTAIFVAWWQIDLYQTPIYDYEKFIEEMDNDERRLFILGATLEAINWYRAKKKEFGEDEYWRLCSEFPSTDVEAFQSTGGAYFPKEYVDMQYNNCCDPVFVGDIYGTEMSGEAAMDNIHLVPEDRGKLKIWKMPETQVKMRNRYLITVDVCVGSTPQADYSIIYVVDRYWQHEADGIPETAAEWHGHIDVDQLAWKAAQLAKFYDDALLVIEKNSIDSNRVPAYRTILKEIKTHVRNLYKKTDFNKMDDNVEKENYGWSTNGSSKPQICQMLASCLRDQLYIEHCKEAVDELNTFERKQDGHTLGAVDGCHDDRVITRAIAMYFIYKPLMPPPTFITEKDIEKPNTSFTPNTFTI